MTSQSLLSNSSLPSHVQRIDVLRGIAICTVFLYHVSDEVNANQTQITSGFNIFDI